jgi:iron transport multicopper oxidase
MSLFRAFIIGAVLFSSISQSLGSIGPVADLNISNVYIQPDGYNRSTVLAGGTFPGAVITANKV